MRTLVIDASPILYMSVFARDGLALATEDGRRTECAYRLITTIFSMCELYSTNKVVVTFDSKINNRKLISPDYKANRQEVPENIKEKRKEIFEQIPRIKEFLTTSNIEWYELEGFESDDLIASICFNNPGFFTLIVSDHDMYQLLRPNIDMYFLSKRRKYTMTDFENEFGIPSTKYHQVLALAGDPTDNIKGIPSIGERTALNFVKKTLSSSSKKYKEILKGKDLYFETMRLVKLPLENCPVIKLEYKVPSYTGFIEACENLEFASILKKRTDPFYIDNWKSVLFSEEA